MVVILFSLLSDVWKAWQLLAIGMYKLVGSYGRLGGSVIIYCLLFMGSVMVVNAQDLVLSGEVLDVKKQPLEGVRVQIVELGIQSTTNSKGQYFLHAPTLRAGGAYNVEWTYIGKKTIKRQVKTEEAGRIASVVMVDNSLMIEDIPVVAGEGERSNSSMVFDREMIERFPALSLNDLLNRLPNRENVAPSVQDMQNLTLRSAFTETIAGVRNVQELNNAFGVAIIVDDMTMSNNGNMQGRNVSNFGMGNATHSIRPSDYGFKGNPSSNKSYSGENVFGGIDLRQIPVENIERIEVISGVAPVRYGDISNGAVLVDRQAGRTPAFFRTQVRSNATSYGLSKGFGLGDKLGSLNVDIGYVTSYADNRDKLKEYKRINGNMIWTNYLDRSKRLKQHVSFGYSKIIDQVNHDPDDSTSPAVKYGGYNWDVSARTSLSLNRSFLKKINFNMGFREGSQVTYRETDVNVAYVLYTHETLGGIYEGNYAEGIYTAIDHVDNKPINASARLEADGLFYTGVILHRVNFGSNYSYDYNLGKGRMYDPSMPTRNQGGAANSDRYYDFSLAKPLHNLGFYADDAMRMPIGERELAMRVGLRGDVMNGHFSLSPRVNMNMQLNDRLNVGVAYGLSYKAPGLAQLYPGPKFEDIILLNAYNGIQAESTSRIYVRRYEADNSNLKASLGQTLEASLSWRSGGHVLRANIFYKRNSRGINTVNDLEVIHLPSYEATAVVGEKPKVEETGTTRYLVQNPRFDNDLKTSNKGVELIYASPKISALKTSFSVTAGLTSAENSRKSLESETISAENMDATGVRYAQYSATMSKVYLSRASIRSSTHIPALRFILELSADVQLMNYNKIAWNDLVPRGYYNVGLEYFPIEQYDPNNEVHSFLYEQRKIKLDRLNNSSNLMYWNFNLSMAKEIGKNIYLSFNVYNFLDYQPRFYKNDGITIKAPNSSPNYGAQLTYKF
ncbi:TonB-dependent receptor [Sphingobacterium sp. UT-1RO-CII-1]|uniref:TonB-dependent receptor domain-containing protein n=1 Tax=Sphingobacterium sp. UT-1RO-CII-1 TaxID=2995225 RepID=UPI00227B4404|nr:TonB-dependent receptor [Sphingobacterium sp. UT-1RO-CII-1]MCY4780766.1 TonB-dependent receptor [Sphingobacterium sp. UT-1RO-CII-1]